MFIYLLLLLYIYIIGYIFLYRFKSNEKSKLYFLFLAFGAMTLILGFRGNRVGEDTDMYLRIAEIAKHKTWKSVIESFPNMTWSIDQWGYHSEISTFFFILVKLIVGLFGSSQAVLFVCSLVICTGFACFIYQNTNRVFLATYVFVCDSIFMMSFNGMRQCLAMAIGLQAYTEIKEKKYVNALIYIAIATLFHSVSIVYLLFFPIMIYKNKKRELMMVIATALAFPILLIYIQTLVAMFSPYLASYFSTSFWEASLGGTVFLFFFIILSSVYSFLFIKREILAEQFDVLFFVILQLTLEIAGIKATMISRLALYFRAFLILFFPLIEERFFKKNNRRLYIVLLFMLITMEYLSYAKSETRLYVPYWMYI